MTARLEKRSKSSWGGRRKGAGRRPKVQPGGDDYEERQAVYEACGALLELMADELRVIEQWPAVAFVLGHRTGIERAMGVIERYRSSVRLEREAPVTRVRFVA